MDRVFRKKQNPSSSGTIPEEGEFKCSLGYAYSLYNTYERRILDCIYNQEEISFQKLKKYKDIISDEFTPFCNGKFPKVEVVDRGSSTRTSL